MFAKSALSFFLALSLQLQFPFQWKTEPVSPEIKRYLAETWPLALLFIPRMHSAEAARHRKVYRVVELIRKITFDREVICVEKIDAQPTEAELLYEVPRLQRGVKRAVRHRYRIASCAENEEWCLFPADYITDD